MNRSELLKQMAERSQLPQTTCRLVLQHLQQSLCQALHEGETVYIPKLGVFEVRHHLPRSGRNPQTGELIEIPLRTVAAFKPASDLKKAVNN